MPIVISGEPHLVRMFRWQARPNTGGDRVASVIRSIYVGDKTPVR